MKDIDKTVVNICQKHGKDRTRLVEILRDVQKEYNCVPSEALNAIAKTIKMHRVEVESVATFYSFLSRRPKGRIAIYLCNDIIDEFKGADEVAKAFSKELGIGIGEVTADGQFSLDYTPCIGMCDQAPAALINNVVVTSLNAGKVHEIVQTLKKTDEPQKLVTKLGDGNNAHELIKAMVQNNVCKTGPVIFADMQSGAALKKAVAMSPTDVIQLVKTAKLRGRGGAGFPTGMKWEFTRNATGKEKYILCNADEGEPGTFKDRVLLTEKADTLLEGMAIAGYAIGAEQGILYLRGEYAYLQPYLEYVIQQRRKNGLLGKNICGKSGFDFDVRLQMGAGAYICGEETALITSCEGGRGDPKNRPPFPANKGYLGCPSAINNVETFCCAARILEMGPEWFTKMGSKASAGTKVLSISGDCSRPGVYEFPFGTKLSQVLAEAGAEDVAAVQVGGPAGQMVGRNALDRTICYDDLATGGSLIVFNSTRNVLEIAIKFMEFFVEESCGYCTPCRVGNVLLKKKLEAIVNGDGERTDLAYMEELGKTMIATSRCGLGQTSPNPILTTMKNFRSLYDSLTPENKTGLHRSFKIEEAIGELPK